jgi:cytochrome c biogenesis protein CcmG/thiol:disulfide interchange protein DsbE
MPLLQQTHRRISQQGGMVLGIDTSDATDRALEFLRRYRITFPSLRDRDRSYGREFDVAAYPETFIIDRQGRIAALKRGPVTSGWLNLELGPLLAERQ